MDCFRTVLFKVADERCVKHPVSYFVLAYLAVLWYVTHLLSEVVPQEQSFNCQNMNSLFTGSTCSRHVWASIVQIASVLLWLHVTNLLGAKGMAGVRGRWHSWGSMQLWSEWTTVRFWKVWVCVHAIDMACWLMRIDAIDMTIWITWSHCWGRLWDCVHQSDLHPHCINEDINTHKPLVVNKIMSV